MGAGQISYPVKIRWVRLIGKGAEFRFQGPNPLSPVVDVLGKGGVTLSANCPSCGTALITHDGFHSPTWREHTQSVATTTPPRTESHGPASGLPVGATMLDQRDSGLRTLKTGYLQSHETKRRQVPLPIRMIWWIGGAAIAIGVLAGLLDLVHAALSCPSNPAVRRFAAFCS